MTFGRGLRALSIASAVLITGAFALVFFYAPNDADQGFIQKIFYLHVPLAIVALCGFVAGGVYGIRFLRSGDRLHDLRSYVAIHLSLILAFTAELFMGTPGLGQAMNFAVSYGLNDQLYALALATGFLGLAIHFLTAAAERRLLRWHPSQRAESA